MNQTDGPHDTPRYVLPSMTDATTVLRRLTRTGWHTREGFAVADPTWDLATRRLVLYGRIPDTGTAQLVVLAAARGLGVIAVTDPHTEPGRALVSDLSRLGPVRCRLDDEQTTNDPLSSLLPEQRALLDRLAAGETIAAAAAAEFLSLRTANRRIAEARALLGVRTTREAVLAYLRFRGPR